MLVKIISVLNKNYTLFLIGLKNTFLIWIISILISVILAFLWGSMREKKISHPHIVLIADIFSYIIQGVPFYILALISFFYIAPLFNCHNSLLVGSLSLGLCSAAYGSQIIKSGYESIPTEQWILAKQLGYNKFQTLRYIIIAQLTPHVIPLYINEFDQLLKSTSILSTLGILDLTKSGMNIINNTFEVFPVYFILFIIYLSMSMILRYFAYLYKKNINQIKM